MKDFLRLSAALVAAVSVSSAALAQSSPGLTYRQVPTAGQWNSYFAAKQDVLGFTPLNSEGGTMTGRLITSASPVAGSTAAGLNLSPGSAPASPVDGDLWMEATGLYARVNGVTVGPYSSSNGGSFAATLPLAVTFPSSVVTYALNYDSNFTTAGGNLAFAPIGAGDLLANSTAGSAAPTATSLTALLDQVFGSTSGRILQRGASAWAANAFTGDGTLSDAGVFTLTSIPGGVTLSGYLDFNTIPTPPTPSTGDGRVYVDQTTKALGNIDDAGIIHSTVVPSAAVATQFMTGITAAGVITRAQPTCADISGAGTGCSAAAGITALTGDVSATGPGSVAGTLATVNSNVGSFGSSTAIPNFTVNGKGLITAAGSSAVIAPAGTLTGATLASNVLASSLSSVGTLTGGGTGAGFTVNLGASTISGTLPTANDPALTGDVTKSAGSSATTIAPSVVSNAKMANAAAYTLKGNFTGAAAAPQDSAIGALTQKVSPAGTDLVLIQDQAASGQLRYVEVSSLASAGSVSSIDAKTGAFTTANGIESTGGNVIQLTTAQLTQPTTQRFTTAGVGTYTRPANVVSIRIKMVGGGGGGGGTGTSPGGGGTGGNTCWAASGAACAAPIIQANGGGGGGSGASSGNGSGGGTVGGNIVSVVGSDGDDGLQGTTLSGGGGGSSCFGGSGGGGRFGLTPGSDAAANSGSGGGGGGVFTTGSGSGGGGGSGGCIEHRINAPAASYTYAIGGPGTAGTAGTSGVAGGAGGSGVIIVEEFYH